MPIVRLEILYQKYLRLKIENSSLVDMTIISR